jgi:hypothetical protein
MKGRCQAFTSGLLTQGEIGEILEGTFSCETRRRARRFGREFLDWL